MFSNLSGLVLEAVYHMPAPKSEYRESVMGDLHCPLVRLPSDICRTHLCLIDADLVDTADLRNCVSRFCLGR